MRWILDLKETISRRMTPFNGRRGVGRAALTDAPANDGMWQVDCRGTDNFVQAEQMLVRLLTENIIPFWYPRTIDYENGGYRLNHDLEGRWRGPASKFLVTQARTLWFFSRLVNSRHGCDEYLEAASHGYRFLCERMWDREFGGFYWEVDCTGQRARVPDKRLYGQAFGLYALVEYAMASGDSSADALSRELFGLLESKAHDSRHGGYADVLQRNWTSGRAMDRPIIKRMNTHLHLLEAVTSFLGMTGGTVARERLVELILINSSSVVRKTIGACTDRYHENWDPLCDASDDRVSYGHDVENVWLLARACKSAGIPVSLLTDLYRTLFRYTLRYGYDDREGGFFDSGKFNTPADRREKIWWFQAEGLIAALQMHRLTGDKIYENCFLGTLNWIIDRQADWRCGDWYEKVNADGTAAGIKAGPWKGPYHNGRAMLECLDLLAT